MQSPIDKSEGRRRGEQRRDTGMMFAALLKRRQIWSGTVALIDALLANPTHEATTDDAVADFGESFADGGKWRGSIPRDLANLKLVVDTGRTVKSCREHRHGARIVVWHATDLVKLAEHRLELLALLDAYPEPPDDLGESATLRPIDRGPAPNEKGDAVAAASPLIESPVVTGEFSYES